MKIRVTFEEGTTANLE